MDRDVVSRGRRSRLWVQALGGIFTLVASLALLAYVTWQRSTAFTVTAETELATVTIATPDGTATNPLDQAEVTVDGKTNAYKKVRLLLYKGTRVLVRRTARGPLDIELESGPGEQLAGAVSLPDGQQRELRSGSFVRIPLTSADSAEPVYLAFEGLVAAGDIVRPRSGSALRSGSITIVERPLFQSVPLIGRALLGNVPYVVSHAPLDPGDRVQFIGAHDEPVEAFGFIAVGPGPAMQLTAHAAAKAVKVDRFGSTGYQIRATLAERIVSEPLIIFLTVLLGLIISVVQVILPLRLSERP